MAQAQRRDVQPATVINLGRNQTHDPLRTKRGTKRQRVSSQARMVILLAAMKKQPKRVWTLHQLLGTLPPIMTRTAQRQGLYSSTLNQLRRQKEIATTGSHGKPRYVWLKAYASGPHAVKEIEASAKPTRVDTTIKKIVTSRVVTPQSAKAVSSNGSSRDPEVYERLALETGNSNYLWLAIGIRLATVRL